TWVNSGIRSDDRRITPLPSPAKATIITRRPMSLPNTLSIALKEWAAVCRALETGRQMILLRKGGIYESAGEFEVENRQFLLFPTFLHQNLAMLKPEAHVGFQPHAAEPS